MMKKILISLGFLALSSINPAFAAGKIVQINVAGPDDPNHPNIVQLVIEGGYAVAGCDTIFAAIRNTDNRKDLIAFAFAAYTSGQSVNITLNPADKYYASRCSIARISNQ